MCGRECVWPGLCKEYLEEMCCIPLTLLEAEAGAGDGAGVGVGDDDGSGAGCAAAKIKIRCKSEILHIIVSQISYLR